MKIEFKEEFEDGSLTYTVQLNEDRCSVNIFTDSGGGSTYSFNLSMLHHYIEVEKNEKLNSIFINLDRRLKLKF